MPSIEQKIQSYLNFSKGKADSIFKNSNHELKDNPLKKVDFNETKGCEDTKAEIKKLKSESDSNWKQMNDLRHEHDNCLFQAKKVDGRYYPKGDTTQTPCHIYDEVAKDKMKRSLDQASKAAGLEEQYNKYCK